MCSGYKGVPHYLMRMQVGRGEDGVIECSPHYSYVCGLKCVLSALYLLFGLWQMHQTLPPFSAWQQ